MTKGRILLCDILPQIPAATCANLCISIRCMILITVNSTFCTASVCNEYKIVFCQNNTLLNAMLFALNCRCNLLSILKFKNNICYFNAKSKLNASSLKILLHWKNQRFILIILCKFQCAEIRQTRNMMNETLEVKLHLKCTVPVFKCEHGTPVQPECRIEYFIIKYIFDCLIIQIFILCHEKLHDFHTALLT